ncbi:hypothetical protein D3C80_1425290 [compost metagenome]
MSHTFQQCREAIWITAVHGKQVLLFAGLFLLLFTKLVQQQAPFLQTCRCFSKAQFS